MKLLQEDPTDATRDILLHISRQLATPSTAAFNATDNPFVAPEWALQVNYCFFVSLSCALITALAAVLALQWVSSYDCGLDPSSVETCALQRQFRMDGAKRWKMKHIVGTLPNLIFISLLLFFVGLAEWLWYIHHNVAIIVIVGVSVGALFYAITTLASIVSVAAPFRTPASRYLPMWFGLALQFITVLFQNYLPHLLFLVFGRIAAERADMTLPVSKVQEIADEFSRGPPKSRWRKWLGTISKPFPPRYSIEPLEPLEDREQRAVRNSDTIKLSSLFWLARSISIEPYQRQTLMIIMQAILDPDQPEWQRHNDRDNAEVWKRVFTELHVPFANKRKWVDYSQEDLTDSAIFVHGLTSIGQGFLKDGEFQVMLRSFYGSYNGFKSMCRIMKEWKKWRLESASLKPDLENQEQGIGRRSNGEDKENTARRTLEAGTDRATRTIIRLQPAKAGRTSGCSLVFRPQMKYKAVLENLEDVLGAREDFPLEFIAATLQQVKQNVSGIDLKAIQELFDLITKNLRINRNHATNTTPLPFPVLDLVQELIISLLSETAVTPFDSSAYFDIVKRYFEQPRTEEKDLVYEKAIAEVV
jgi:hypothetical protein